MKNHLNISSQTTDSYGFWFAFFLFFLLIINSLSLNAQTSKIDSLLHILKNANENKKIEVLNEISIAYRITSLNNSLDYANQALKLAIKHNNISGQAEAYKNIGIVYYMQNKTNEAIVEYKKSLKLFKFDKNELKVAALLNNIGIIYVTQGEFQLALNNFNEAIETNTKSGNQESLANIYNNVGMVYSRWGNYNKSFEFYSKSLKISRELGNKLSIAAALNNIALVQKSRGKYDKALENYQEAIKINEQIDDKSGIARCFNNMAAVYTALGDTLKAIELTSKSIELKKELNDEQGIIISYLSIGNLQLQLGDYTNAINSYQKSLDISIKANDKKNMLDSYSGLGSAYLFVDDVGKAFEYFSLALEIAKNMQSADKNASLYNKIGRCLFKKHQYNDAKQNFLLSLNIAKELDFLPLIEKNYLNLAEVSVEMKNFEDAYKYQSENIKIHQTIFNNTSQAKIAQLEANYENEKNEKEIIELKIQQEKITRRNQLIIVIAIIIIFLISFVFLLNRYLIKRKTVKLLDQKNTLLKKTNLELIAAKEKAEESDKLKTAFLATISHEIRTPMNAIIGFSEFLADNNLSENEKKEFFQIIRINSEMLLGLIDDFLDISLIETGQLRIKSEQVSLNKLMDETYQLFKVNDKLKQSNIDFTYFMDEYKRDLIIISDSFRLKQILSNLIDNAIKFTDSGQISFAYKIVDMDNKMFVRFSVDDSGIGIDNKFQSKIFDRFFKVPSDNTYSFKGSGIGLSIVKSLVSFMGGDVWFNSVPGNGSTFFFTIPLTHSSDKAAI